MNRTGERELPNLQSMRDHLIADEASHVADETFCLVVPIDSANYGLLDFQSHRIVGTLTWQQGPVKQTRYRWWYACQLSDA